MPTDPAYRQPDFQRLRDAEATRRAAQEAEEQETRQAVREMRSAWLGLKRSLAEWSTREKEAALDMRGEYALRQEMTLLLVFGGVLALGLFFAAMHGP